MVLEWRFDLRAKSRAGSNRTTTRKRGVSVTKVREKNPGEKNQGKSEPIIQPLDKNGFIPLYYQIQRALMEKIQSGELCEGDPLASEEELSRNYQVSRMTARQALHGLKTNGYAFSEKGRGTFVTRPKLEKNIMHLQGFTEDMRQRGMKASSRLLDQSVVAVNDDLGEKLRLNPGDDVFRLRRLRLADNIPMAREERRQKLALRHAARAVRRARGLCRRNHRGSSGHARRSRAADHPQQVKHSLHQPHYSYHAGNADRIRLLALSRRPLPCADSRSDDRDRIALHLRQLSLRRAGKRRRSLVLRSSIAPNCLRV
jgi:DNA-binding transcriptional regulator YhcF (GntR family)